MAHTTPRQPAVNQVSAAHTGRALIRYTPSRAETEPVSWGRAQRRTGRMLAVATPLVILVAWEIAARTGTIDARLFPGPIETGIEGFDLAASGELFVHLRATLSRIVYGAIPGVLLGVLVGMVLGRQALVRAAFAPTLAAAYTIPKLGIFPLLLLIFGIGETSKIVLAAWAAFLVTAIAATDAVNGVPQRLLDVGRTVGIPRHRQFLEVVLPAALPQLFTALRLTVGIVVLVVIGTEFIASNEGIGWLIWNSWGLFQPARMYVGIFMSALIGVGLSALIGGAERLCMPWRDGGRRKAVRPLV